jgi:hypothetical protein
VRREIFPLRRNRCCITRESTQSYEDEYTAIPCRLQADPSDEAFCSRVAFFVSRIASSGRNNFHHKLFIPRSCRSIARLSG